MLLLVKKLLVSDSRAVAQVVSASNTVVEYVPLNANTFIVGETVTFKDSSVEAVIQITSPGSYLNITPNYRLDKGHRHQYCDYSRIVRRPGSPTPSKKLLIFLIIIQLDPLMMEIYSRLIHIHLTDSRVIFQIFQMV